MNSSDQIEYERQMEIADTVMKRDHNILRKLAKQTDDQYASHPSHKAAMVVRAVMGSIADIPDVAPDLSPQDIDDLKLAHARLGDYLFSRLRRVA